MAEDRATAYANWIVKNQDKKGTPEFDTVANAYKQLRAGGDSAPAQDAAPVEEIGTGESALRGGAQGATFNLNDEISGVLNLPVADVAEAGWDWITGRSGKKVSDLVTGEDNSAAARVQRQYETVRDRVRKRDADAMEQHPIATVGGNIAGGVLATAPLGGIAGGAGRVGMLARGAGFGKAAPTVVGRVGQGVRQGAATGAAYGAGAGEGGVVDRIEKAASGALVGGVTGGVATGAIEGAMPVARKVAGAYRAVVNPDEAASRVVSRGLAEDAAGGTAGMTPQEYADALRRGDPVVIADMGGSRTLSTARSAANTSPEARGGFDKLNEARFQTQGDRVNDTLRQSMGQSDATGTAVVPYDPNSGAGKFSGGAKISAADDLEALTNKAKAENKVKYDKAHSDAETVDLWDHEFQRLAAAPPVRKAIKEVLEMGDTAAVVQGGRPIRSPFVRGKDGEWRIRATQRADGTTEVVRPNLEFWDHVQRKLRAQAENLGTDKYAAGQLGALRKALTNRLDAKVGAFQEAREGAAKFFGAADAHEAGMKFFNPQGALEMGQAQKAINRMSKSERELFARGYAANFAEAVDKAPDRASILNRLLQNKQARLRTQMALGPRRAAQMEARFRVESIMDRLRTTMGNSSTARQLAEMGMASGAGGAIGLATGGDYSSAGLGALMGAATRFGLKKVDARVAERVGKILVSQDAAALQRLVQSAAADRKVMEAIRAFEGAASRLGGGQVGGRVPGIPMMSGGLAEQEPAPENRNRR